MPGLENLKWIPKGREGTRRTIAEMKRLVDEGKKNFQLATIASDIVSTARERDQRGEVDRVFKWVKRNIRFVNDPYGVEMIQAPLYTIQRGAGDCDDLSTLLNALCASIGYNTAFKTIKADRRVPHEFSHVYSLIEINGEWVPADPSQKTRPLGWEPPAQWGYQVWGYSRGSITKTELPANLKGLGMPQENLKEKVVSWIMGMARGIRRRTAPAAVAPAPTPARQVTIEPVARPGNKFTEDSHVVNEYQGEPYDPEDHRYYGDYNDEGAGKYNMQRKEIVAETGEAIAVMYKLPRIYGPEYYKDRRLDDKMQTRIINRLPDLTAVKDGSPERS